MTLLERLLFPSVRLGEHRLRAAVAGKTVLITGASFGIGEALALLVGAAGARVVLVARTVDKLEAVRARIEAAGGQATAVAADKVVTVSIDGREQVVHTFAADVGGALASAGIVATGRDRLEPAPSTDLADGDHVILQRARPLTLVEGPSERRIWTTAASVQDALRGAGARA